MRRKRYILDVRNLNKRGKVILAMASAQTPGNITGDNIVGSRYVLPGSTNRKMN